MLDPLIIAEIQRREREEASRELRIELPLMPPDGWAQEQAATDEEDELSRGVTVIDM